MTYTYAWTDAEQSGLKRTDADGNVAFVPTDPGNRDYVEFLSSGATATAYVEPEPPAPMTTEQKVNNMLAAYGLSREEMVVALQVKAGGVATADEPKKRAPRKKS